MNEAISQSPESINNSEPSPWDTLKKLPSFEEHIKKLKNIFITTPDINSQVDQYIANQQAIRQKQSQAAFIDGMLEHPLREAERTRAKEIQDIMAIDEEIKQNQFDYDHNLDFRNSMQLGLEQHKEVIRGERTREILEKILNNSLTKIDDLENLADIDGIGVTSSEVEYNQNKIKVLNLENIPFTMLTHSIDFKQNNIHQVIGQGTSNALRSMPSLWLDHQDQANIGGKPNYNSRSNVIFTTYSSTGNPNVRPVGGDIIYGFDHINAGSLLKVSARDGNTPLALDYRNNYPSQYDLSFLDEVENGASNGGYNEVAIKRYDETGKPKVPDYLVVYDGFISEDAKNHASTFKIPIINIVKNTPKSNSIG